jgi:hypothetical protein
MPIDWDDFQASLDTAVESAKKKTDDELAGRAASITRLTEDEVKKLFPTPADVQGLKDLMEIVKSSEKRNQQVARIEKNIESLGGTILTLLQKFA